jgi:hypothetical protein
MTCTRFAEGQVLLKMCFSPTQGCRKHNPGTRWRARPSWHGSWVLYSSMFINLAFPMTRLLTLVLQFFRFGTGACMGSTPSGGSRRERLPDHCVSVLAVQAPLTCAAMKRSLASSRDHSPLTSSCRGRSTRSGGGVCYVRPVWKASASIGFNGVRVTASASPRCRPLSTRYTSARVRSKASTVSRSSYGRSHWRCPNSIRTAPGQASWTACSLNGRRSRFPPRAGMQGLAVGVEIALFRLETVLLVMISPLALMRTPVVVMINRSRHNRHDRRRLRLHRHCAQHQNRRNR